MKNKILITGSSGQLGMALSEILRKDYTVLVPSRKEMNLSFPDKVKKYLKTHSFNFIVNCAAYTKVDEAELDKTNCFKINTDSVKTISQFCEENSIPFIHMSTDYVFGNKNNLVPWKESDAVNPLNIYGLSKSKTENYITSNSSMGLIIRSSGIYSNDNNNFFNTIIKMVAEKKEIKIVGDQFNSPTPTWWLSYAIKEIINLKIHDLLSTNIKILHASTEGTVSWYNFAAEIINILRLYGYCIQYKKLLKISSEHYAAKAKRPYFSSLDNSTIKSLGIKTVDWKEGIKKTILLRKEREIEH